MPLPNLHCQRNSLQRAHLPPGSWPPRILLLPHPLHTTAQDQGSTTPIRPIQDGCLRHTCQHLRADLHLLRRRLDAVPTDTARYKG